MSNFKKKCIYCGSENTADSKYCISCGSMQFESVPEAQSRPSAPPPPPQSQYQQQQQYPPQQQQQGNPFSSQSNSYPAAHHTQTTSTSTRTSMRKKSSIATAVVLFIIISLVTTLLQNLDRDSTTPPPDPDPVQTTFTYNIGQNVSTVWFDFVVNAFEIHDSYAITYQEGVNGNTGGLSGFETITAAKDKQLYVVFVTLTAPNNSTDMNHAQDFSLKAGGFSYALKASDIHGAYNLVKNQAALNSILVFETPNNCRHASLFYAEPYGSSKEYDYWVTMSGNGRSAMNSITPVHFAQAAREFDYELDVDEDYDNAGTYWAGAHKIEGDFVDFDTYVYVIDYTIDDTLSGASKEYSMYLPNVTNIGGKQLKKSGVNFDYQVNLSSLGFGISLRVDKTNLYVVTDNPDHAPEILDFFKELGYDFTEILESNT